MLILRIMSAIVVCFATHVLARGRMEGVLDAYVMFLLCFVEHTHACVKDILLISFSHVKNVRKFFCQRDFHLVANNHCKFRNNLDIFSNKQIMTFLM